MACRRAANHLTGGQICLQVDPLLRVPERQAHGRLLIESCRDMLERHGPCVREHFEDTPEVRDRTWTEDG